MSYRIVAINPGSTSTKIAYYVDNEQAFNVNIEHNTSELTCFAEIVDQIEFRKKAILKELSDRKVDLSQVDAFSGRCTGLLSMEGGVYEVNEVMYQHGHEGIGSKHPGNLGPIIVKDFAEEFGGRAFCVNPSTVDEFIPEARVTGFADIFRTSRGHPLNQKEVAARFAREMDKSYEDINVVVVHMGGGISIGAHMKGRLVDNVDSTRGEGRMAPTRSGALPAADLVELCFSEKYTKKQLLGKIMKTGGWIEHLGTQEGREVELKIQEGDKKALFILNTTVYQIAKDIGAMAAAIDGEVDGILLTGGLANSKRIVDGIKKKVSFIAPVYIYPGEYEMEGLAAGALRVLKGNEKAKSYTGKPVFTGFDF